MAEAVTAARAAALWWAEQIGAMASVIADKHPVDAASALRFADALERRIQEALDRSTYGVSLHVDYGPWMILADAADEAEIHASRFPWKTHMWVWPDHVVATFGYGWQLVWSTPGWQRPTCNENRYDVDGPHDEVCTRPRYHDGEHGKWRPDPARCAHCGGGYRDHFGPDSGPRTHLWTPEHEVSQP